eukprot:gene32365-39140_t
MDLSAVKSFLQGEEVTTEQSCTDFLYQTLASAMSGTTSGRTHQQFCQEIANYGPRQVCQYQDDFHTWAEFNTLLSTRSMIRDLQGPPDEQSEQLMQQRGYLRLKSGLTMTPPTVMLLRLLSQKWTIRILTKKQERARNA